MTDADTGLAREILVIISLYFIGRKGSGNFSSV